MSIPVVIVDDEEMDRYIARRAIAGSGTDCRIIEFNAGDEFTELFDDDGAFQEKIGEVPPPVLVLLDINMPRMNGFEVLEKLKKQFKESKRDPGCFIVLMYSSSNHAKDRADALEYEFVRDYLVKPIDETVFRHLIKKYYE
jgi:two-component system, chemotaxis family, chemotaxis protein CheY